MFLSIYENLTGFSDLLILLWDNHTITIGTFHQSDRKSCFKRTGRVPFFFLLDDNFLWYFKSSFSVLFYFHSCWLGEVDECVTFFLPHVSMSDCKSIENNHWEALNINPATNFWETCWLGLCQPLIFLLHSWLYLLCYVLCSCSISSIATNAKETVTNPCFCFRYSPNIKEIKVVSHRKVRRARLYYLRDKLPRLSTFK